MNKSLILATALASCTIPETQFSSLPQYTSHSEQAMNEDWLHQQKKAERVEPYELTSDTDFVDITEDEQTYQVITDVRSQIGDCAGTCHE